MSKGAVGFITAAALTAFLIVGCGGGGGGSADLTKAEFVKQGNAICKKAEAERFAIFQKETEKLSPSEEKEGPKREEIIVAGMQSYGKATEQLSDLGSPAGEEEKVASFLEAMEEALLRVEQNPGTVLVSDAPFRKPNDQAKKLGLVRCIT